MQHLRGEEPNKINKGTDKDSITQDNFLFTANEHS